MLEQEAWSGREGVSQLPCWILERLNPTSDSCRITKQLILQSGSTKPGIKDVRYLSEACLHLSMSSHHHGNPGHHKDSVFISPR